MKPYIIAILVTIIFTAAYSASSAVYMPGKFEAMAPPQSELEEIVLPGIVKAGCFRGIVIDGQVYTCHQDIKWTPGKLEIEP